MNENHGEPQEHMPVSAGHKREDRSITSDGGLTLPYRDDEFLDSEDGRPIRILAEYLAPLRAF